MNTNEKAATGSIDSSFKTNPSNHTRSINQRQFSGNYSAIMGHRQCKKCDSDYMRFAIDGICIRCQQRVEFLVREHPDVVGRAMAGGQR